MSYSFPSILINGREVGLNDILHQSVVALSNFETSTFSFIQNWFSPIDTFIQHTSGSTGTPKPITIARQQMIASAQLTQQALELRSGDTALVCLDTEFIAGKMMIVRSFIADMKIIAVNPSSNPFRELSANEKIDFTALVPFQLHEILQSLQVHRLNSIKNILVGGAALSEETKKNLSKFRSCIYATYGMTETVSHVALQRVNGPLASEYFTLLPDIKINIEDRGCLEITAPYLGEKVTTNDIVEIKDGSKFKWLGRSDNIINSGGIKIIPEKIEAEIQKLFNRLKIKNRFFLSSAADPALSNKLILLIEGSVPLTLIENIKLSLQDNLPRYEIPKEYYTNIDFVLTKNGKINRAETTRKIGI